MAFAEKLKEQIYSTEDRRKLTFSGCGSEWTLYTEAEAQVWLLDNQWGPLCALLQESGNSGNALVSCRAQVPEDSD